MRDDGVGIDDIMCVCIEQYWKNASIDDDE